jgi:iron complex outermembrane receptor protein
MWCALLVAGSLRPAPATAQPNPSIATAQISGEVNDATGLPLAGVTLRVSGAAVHVARTGPDGRFEFRNLAPGSYELTATLAEFAPETRRIDLASAERARVAITLSVHILEQTIVTAARLGSSDVQTTALSVGALSADDLQSVGARTIEHLAGLAPALTFSQNTGFAQLTIRGIGSNTVFAGTDPSNAVYLDGVYLARPAMVLTDFLELDRVEVLRGPQGTLYGRNAVGGALNVISKTPTDTVEASARFLAGGYGMFRGDARLSGPIVPGKVMASGAFLWGVRDGYVQDLEHPDHPLESEDVVASRGQVRVVLNARNELLVRADVANQDPVPMNYPKVLAVKAGFQVDNPDDLHEVRASLRAWSRNRQYGTSARYSFYLTPQTTVTSLTAFRKLDYHLVVDGDITELDLTVSDVHERQHQISQELTVSHQHQLLKWVAGGFFFDEDDRQPSLVTAPTAGARSLLDPRVTARTAAVFGQATAAIAPRLSITAGLRFSDERKHIDNSGHRATLESPLTPLTGSAYAYSDSLSDTAWTPKFGVEFQAQPHTLAYLSATRGFKTGGVHLTSTQPGRGYAPEWAWSYEGGVKTTAAAGRARVSLAVFQTDYTDLQVQTAIRPGVIDISNAAAATIRGMELESAMRVLPSLEAGGHLAWLDARYDQYIAIGVGGVTGDVSGNRLTNAPEWSGRVWIESTHQLGRAARLALHLDSTWQSTVFYTPFNDTTQQQRRYGLLDASAEYGPTNGRWSVSVFARNLANEDYITGSFSSPPPAIGGRPGDPRQVGVRLTVAR